MEDPLQQMIAHTTADTNYMATAVDTIENFTSDTSTQSHKRECEWPVTDAFHVIKRLHRTTIKSAHATNEMTVNVRKDVESTNQTAQNLQYEKSLLIRDIRECRSFRSRHTAIELVSEEEFLHEAPDELKSEAIRNDPHQLFSARLKWEKMQRQSLVAKQKELQHRIIELKEINERKRERCHVTPIVDNLIKATSPLYGQLAQEYNNQDRIATTDMRESLLPPSLYTLYANLVAYAMANKRLSHSKCTVRVKGKADAAQEYNRTLSLFMEQESLAESEPLEHDVDDEDDDDDKLSHRRKAKAPVTPIQITREQALSPHPLSLLVEFPDFQLHFFRFPYVSITTVRAVAKHARVPPLLTHLYPSAKGNDGIEIAWDADEGSQPPKCADLSVLQRVNTEYIYRIVLIGGKGEGKTSLAKAAGNSTGNDTENIDGLLDMDGDDGEIETTNANTTTDTTTADGKTQESRAQAHTPTPSGKGLASKDAKDMGDSSELGGSTAGSTTGGSHKNQTLMPRETGELGELRQSTKDSHTPASVQGDGGNDVTVGTHSMGSIKDSKTDTHTAEDTKSTAETSTSGHRSKSVLEVGYKRRTTLPNGTTVTLHICEAPSVKTSSGRVSSSHINGADAVVVVYSAMTKSEDDNASRGGASLAKTVHQNVNSAIAKNGLVTMEKPDDIDTQAPSAATAAKFPPMVTFVCTKGPKYDAEKRSVSETKADSGRSKSQGKAAANEIALLHEQDDVLSLTTGEGVSEWFDALAYSLWERAHHHDSQWLSQLSTVYGAPFEWVQRLSNTDDKAKDTVPSAAVAAESINSTPRLSGEERRNQFGTTIALVCERMTVGKDLSAQLAALKKKTIDLSSPLLAEVAEQFQLRPTANLTEWTQTENTPSYSTYLMALSRNGWVLQATITLSVNYPRVTPSFALTMKATGSTPDPDLSSVIKHMEVDTNVYCHELFVTSENVLNYLLVLQIRRLQMMFDMYVHILQSTDSRGVMIGRLYERKRRGKDRHLPTRYQADKGVFTHR